MQKIALILDLDGVLITTPIWKADEIDFDNYSKFNPNCVDNLNQLLEFTDFEIYLSSERRKTKTLEEFNQIFKNRGIIQEIKDFVPVYPNSKNRREEIKTVLSENQIENFLIVDDDKSLLDTEEFIKERLILTSSMLGFNDERLSEVKNKILVSPEWKNL